MVNTKQTIYYLLECFSEEGLIYYVPGWTKTAKSCENNKQAKDRIVQNNKPQYLLFLFSSHNLIVYLVAKPALLKDATSYFCYNFATTTHNDNIILCATEALVAI